MPNIDYFFGSNSNFYGYIMQYFRIATISNIIGLKWNGFENYSILSENDLIMTRFYRYKKINNLEVDVLQIRL